MLYKPNYTLELLELNNAKHRLYCHKYLLTTKMHSFARLPQHTCTCTHTLFKAIFQGTYTGQIPHDLDTLFVPNLCILSGQARTFHILV